MDSIDFWKVLSGLKQNFLSKFNKIIIFGENGSEVIFSTRDGKVYGFGNNSFGELGFGHKIAVRDPEIIVELNDKQIVDFSYGFDYVLAKTITGKLYSWGDNSYGQLGIGNNISNYSPKLIDSLSDKCVIEMSCGYNHTLVLTEDRQLYGFGRNSEGQIGCRNFKDQLKPIRINGFNNENVVSISCGTYHSLALTQTGYVYSWGWNEFGQLGNGNKTDTNIPTKITVSNDLLFKQIVCGYCHSLILSDCGDVYAFGYNMFGSLGTENTIHSSVPLKVSKIKNVEEIESHFYSYISMAKLEDNTCFVWGLCLGINILKPEETQFNSFNDIIAIYCKNKMTIKPIKCYSKSNRISDNISDKFNDKDFSDIVFKVEDKQIFVNKFILRVNSKYFRNKYSVKSTEISESSTETVEAKDVENIEIINNYSYEVFYSYLKYLYTDCIEIKNQYLDQLLILSIDHKEEDLTIQCTEKIFSSDNNSIQIEKIVELMKYSINKNISYLKTKCLDRIKSMKSIDNICNIYEVSIRYGLNELKGNCFEFIKDLKDRNIILKTDSYKKMSKDMRLEIMENTY